MISKLMILAFSFLATISCSSLPTKTESKSQNSISDNSCQEGSVRRGFITPTTQGDLPCSEGTQTCVAGSWLGPHLFESCENNTKSCGVGFPHGSAISGYIQPTSPQGVPCTPATKICLNGTWTGPEVFESCFELPSNN